MPTYEYVCDKCGNRFEKLQTMTDKPLRRCPSCGAKVRRVISGGAGLVFKGSGFYSTDNRRGGSSGPKAETAAEAKACEGTDSPACKSCPRRED